MRFRPPHAAIAACLFFLLAGQFFIPRLGIEDDEALFAAGIFGPRSDLYALRAGPYLAPVMIMSYIGALKTWLLRPVLNAFGTSVWAVREPSLIAGAATIWLTWLLVRRIAGARAGAVASVLLATDSLYLLTTCFDWGPVALQHLLLTGAAYLLVRFWQDNGHASLAAGFFLTGLALWDKSLAVWMITGLSLAAVLMHGRGIARLVTVKRAGIAAAALLAGCLPLLLFNVTHQWATFRGNVSFNTAGLGGKAVTLVETVNGRGLFGYLTATDPAPTPHQPQGPAIASARLAELTGHPRSNLMLYGIAASVLLAPFAGAASRRSIAFSLIAMAAAWCQMALNAKTGGSVHHTILLWPWPAILVAISFAAVSLRFRRAGLPAISVATLILAGSSILVTNEYHATMAREGGTASWTDAIFPLSDYVKNLPVRNAYCVDWGIVDSLRLVSRGRVPVRDITGLLRPENSDQELLRRIIQESDAVFIGHTKEAEFFSGYAARLTSEAAQLGYPKHLLRVVPDSFDRRTFEIFRFGRRSE